MVTKQWIVCCTVLAATTALMCSACSNNGSSASTSLPPPTQLPTSPAVQLQNLENDPSAPPGLKAFVNGTPPASVAQGAVPASPKFGAGGLPMGNGGTRNN